MRRRKVIITGPAIVDEALALLAKSNIDVISVPPYTESEQIEKIVEREEADAILVRMGEIDKNVITASHNLKVIAKHGVGVNNIDIAAATLAKIPVMITPGANSRSVAEHALTMMLALSKKIISLDTFLRLGKWEKTTYKGMELTGKSLGIIGYGAIGRELVKLARPFNMELMIYDPALKPGSIEEQVDVLETLYRRSDIISLHCPLLDSTIGMIGKTQLQMMKDSAYLINTARGGLIEEEDLAWALENGVIAGAALDSFKTEPPPVDTALWNCPNLLVSPHVGAVTVESLRNMGIQAAKNIISVLDKHSLDSACVINRELL